MVYSTMELAEAFIQTGELDDALNALNQHLSDAPHDNKARRLRASVLVRKKDTNQLQIALDDLAKLDDKSVEDYVQQSVIYERMDNATEAIQAMQTAYALASGNERILERLIELLTHEARYAEVLKLIEDTQQNWRWLLRKADVQVLMAHYSDALQTLNQTEVKLKEIFPDLLSPVSRNSMAQIHIARGQALMKLGKLSEAETDLKDALYHIPNDATILFNLALIYALQGDMRRAEKRGRRALDLASPYIRETLMDVLDSDSQFADLKALLTD